MGHKTELLIHWSSKEIHLIEACENSILPSLGRWAVYVLPEAGATDEEIVEYIRQTKFAAGFETRDVTLVLGRKELLMKVEEIPEPVITKVPGYAVQSMGTVFPSSGVEMAAAMLVAKSSEPGKVQAVMVGTKADSILAKVNLFERAGIDVKRILPETVGVFRIMQCQTRSENVITVQLQPDGAELMVWMEGRVCDFCWVPAPDGIGASAFKRRLATTLTEMATAGHGLNVLLLGLEIDVIGEFLTAHTDLKIERYTGYAGTTCQVYQANQDQNITIPADYCAPMVAAGFSPGLAEFKTVKMLAQEIKQKSNRLKLRIGLVLGGLLLGGALALWVASLLHQGEYARMKTSYAILAPKVSQLEQLERETQRSKMHLADWGRALIGEPDWLKALFELQEAVPEGMVFTNIKLDGARECTLNGTAATAQSVTRLATALADAAMFRNVRVIYLKSVTGTGGVEFGLSFTCRNGGGNG